MKTMTPQEAGAFLKKKRQSLGLTAEKVLDHTSIPSAPYLSSIENGKVNPGRSKHFMSLAQYLGLSPEEIEQINPDLFVQVIRVESQVTSEGQERKLQQIKIKKPTRGDLQLSPASRPTLWVDPEKKEGLLVYLIGGEHWILNPENPLQAPVEALGAVVKIDFEH